MQSLGLVSLVVQDYNEALAFYVGKLDFTLIEDTFVPEQNKRWVVIEPPGAGGMGAKLLLARGVGPEQTRASATRPAAGYFCFSTPMTSGAISMRSRRRVSSSRASPAKRPTAPSPCSRICTALYGTWCSCVPSYTKSRGLKFDTTPARGERPSCRPGAHADDVPDEGSCLSRAPRQPPWLHGAETVHPVGRTSEPNKTRTMRGKTVPTWMVPAAT